MKLSLAAIGAVAVLVLAVLFVGSQMVGPTPSQTSRPSTSASASSLEPTPSGQPSATLEQTPVATTTPGATTWTGLDWAVGSVDGGKWLQFNDILPWRGGYVGVGYSQSPAGDPPTSPISPAFFTSADGLHWTVAQEGAAIGNNYQEPDDLLPAHLVPVGDTLLAVGRTPFGTGAPLLWSTKDGSTWTALDNSSWREALATNTLISVAGGPSGVVIVATEGNICCANPQGPPVIIHSSDGVTWDRLVLSSIFEDAYPRDVTAYAGGFAIVGRVGEQQVMDPIPAVGRPAAWTSADGLTWVASQVEGAQGKGAFLYTVIAGSDGLFATGLQADTTGLGNRRPLSGWASADGRSWQLLGEVGTDLPLVTGNPAMVAGDGAHMVIFGRESCKTTELSAWASLDGVTWMRLTFSGQTSYLPTISGPICNDDGTEGWDAGSVGIAYAAVLPDGVFIVTSSSAPTSPGYWFLSATTE